MTERYVEVIYAKVKAKCDLIADAAPGSVWTMLHELCYQFGGYDGNVSEGYHEVIMLGVLSMIMHHPNMHVDTLTCIGSLDATTGLALLQRSGWSNRALFFARALVETYGADINLGNPLGRALGVPNTNTAEFLLQRNANFHLGVALPPAASALQKRYRARQEACRRCATAVLNGRFLRRTGLPRDLMRQLVVEPLWLNRRQKVWEGVGEDEWAL